MLGELEFHGVTRPVEGEVRLRVVDERTVEIEGERVFDLRDYGLEPPRILMLKVYPEVRVRGQRGRGAGGLTAMCLGIPGEIVDVRDDGGLRVGTVRFAGITRDVCLDYVPDAAVGEYVLVHVGLRHLEDRSPRRRRARTASWRSSGRRRELTADRELVETPP